VNPPSVSRYLGVARGPLGRSQFAQDQLSVPDNSAG
jgi:hypothetical protein